MNSGSNLNRFLNSPGIIDIHCHIFPDNIAEKAVSSIGRFYDLDLNCDGKTETLLAEAKDACITRSYVFSTATAISQVDSINSFLSEQTSRHPQLSAFGTLHPEQSAIEINETIGKMLELGLSGIKLHPDFQQVAADAPFVVEVCRQAKDLMPVLLHAGDSRFDFSHPAKISKLAAMQPDCKIIAAHFGGWSQWQEAARELTGLQNVYVDTSSSFPFMNQYEILSLIEKFGTGKILFGSDFPMWKPLDELAMLSSLPIPDDELFRIVWFNANHLFELFH